MTVATVLSKDMRGACWCLFLNVFQWSDSGVRTGKWCAIKDDRGAPGRPGADRSLVPWLLITVLESVSNLQTAICNLQRRGRECVADCRQADEWNTVVGKRK